MANVYSFQFFNGSVPGSFLTVYTVDSAHVGVIRNINAYPAAIPMQPLNGMIVLVNGIQVWKQDDWYAIPGKYYSSDVHIVVPSGQSIMVRQFDASSTAWLCNISGYLLTLP